MQIDPRFRRAAIAAACTLAVLAFAEAILRPILRPYAYSDFVTFYAAARCFDEGRDPYDHVTLQRVGMDDFAGWVGRYLYPPPFAAALVRPLTALPFPSARRVWVVLEAVAYVLACAVLARAGCRGSTRTALLGTGLVTLPFAPMRFDLHLGSVSGLLLLGCALYTSLQNRRAPFAGAALGAAGLLKLVPAFGIMPACVRGTWRSVGWMGFGVIGWMLLALPWTGVEAYVTYARQIVPVLAGNHFSWFTNQSVDALFTRLFAPNPDTTPWIAAPWLSRSCTLVVTLALIAAFVSVVWRARRTIACPDRHRWEFAFALLTGLLVSRVTWEYMVVLALPCFVAWMHEIQQAKQRSRKTIALVLLAYALCALPFPYYQTPLRSGIGLLLAPRLAGMLLLWWMTWRRLAATPSMHEDESLGA
jgi:hypothetical protein